MNLSIYLFTVVCSGAPNWIGDNFCDDQNNNPECNYDGGDCCGPNIDTTYCTECLCINDVTTLPPTTGNLTLSMFFSDFVVFFIDPLYLAVKEHCHCIYFQVSSKWHSDQEWYYITTDNV